MKIVGLKVLRELADEFVAICRKTPDSDVTIDVEATFARDLSGQLGLAVAAEADALGELPVGAEVDVDWGRRVRSRGAGWMRARLHRPARSGPPDG